MNLMHLGDIMSYIVCKKCGGYYELKGGESLENFDKCQCGGDLSYTEKLPQKQEENDKPKLICSNCLKENEDGIFCSKCGGKLIAVKNGRAVNNIKNFDEQKQIENLSDNAFKKVKIDYDVPREPKEFLERISWLGVVIGAVFFVISAFISIFLEFYLIRSSYGYPGYFDFAFTFNVLIIIVCLLSIASGGLAAFISKSRDYDDGLVNGLLVGIISSVILGFFVGISIAIVGIVIFSILAAIGGAVGILLRRKWDG
jgi:hypothetical protein